MEALNNTFELQYAIDTISFLLCGALVMWMAAGFSMLEAGLVRAKNTTEILTKNVALYAISCIMYLICGYMIMYGGELFLTGIENDGVPQLAAELSNDTLKAIFAVDPNLVTQVGQGDDATYTLNAIAADDMSDVQSALANAWLLAESKGAGFDGDSVYSDASDFFFQVVFVATAMSIVSGAVAERMKLWAFLLFAVVMTGFIYPMEGSWTWGSSDVFGLFNLGSLYEVLDSAGNVVMEANDDGVLEPVMSGFSDFAGSGIVHMAGAAAALAGVILLGARKGKYANGRVNAMPGANMPLATLGTLILWMGWFGFNGGSELKFGDFTGSNEMAMVFLNTNAAAAGGAVAALLFARLLFGKADLTMVLNGALAGLVVITADPLSPSALMATLFGVAGGLLVVLSILFLDKVKLDDPVGAISVHGVCGLLGVMLVAVNADQVFDQLIAQAIGAATIFVWVFATSFAVWMILKVVMGLRVSEEEEMEGVDIHECGIEAYPEFTKS